MADHHLDANGHRVRRASHDTPDVESDAFISFKKFQSRDSKAEVKGHRRALMRLPRGAAYAGRSTTMGSIGEYAHRPEACPVPRFSILDDFTEEYDEESEEGALPCTARA